jgi:hypothetical protein
VSAGNGPAEDRGAGALHPTPALGPWEPLSPRDATALLRALPVPWWIAGGWALDLFVGRQTREHADLDVEVLRRDQRALQEYLAGWDLHTASGGALESWPQGMPLPPEVNSVWAWPSPGAPWALQVMFAEAEEDLWLYPRHRSITRPLDRIGLRTAEGIPFLAPEVQLLYKSRAPRAKDQADFDHVLPSLAPDARRWLAGALTEAHPGQPWLARLPDHDGE